MHPPVLPNPSGDGLQFYEKKKPLWYPEDQGNPAGNIGMAVHAVYTPFCCRL